MVLIVMWLGLGCLGLCWCWFVCGLWVFCLGGCFVGLCLCGWCGWVGLLELCWFCSCCIVCLIVMWVGFG